MDPARLKKIPVFADVDGRKAAPHRQPHGGGLRARRQGALVRDGHYSYDVLVIEEGTAKVEKSGDHINELGPGDVVGEMGVLERAQRNADGGRDASPTAPVHAD